MKSVPARFSWQQSLHLVLVLGWSDFCLKYRGSILGYLWSFLGPLAQFFVIFAVFRPFVGAGISHYALYLFLGIIVWEHFSLTTSACVALPQEKAGLIQKTRVPRILLPLATGWTHVAIFLTRLLVFAVIAAAYGIFPRMSYAYLPILLLQMSFLALGIGMLLGAFSLRYRDIAHLWGIALQALFWLTPVMYAIDRLPFSQEALRILRVGIPWHPIELVRAFVRVQPLTLLLADARRTLLLGESLPSVWHMVFVTAFCAGFFCIGSAVFRQRSRSFSQEY